MKRSHSDQCESEESEFTGHEVNIEDLMQNRVEYPLTRKFRRQWDALSMIANDPNHHGVLTTYDVKLRKAGKVALVKGFQVCGWYNFFKEYRQMPEEDRIFYENIMTGCRCDAENHNEEAAEPGKVVTRVSDEAFHAWSEEQASALGWCHFYADVDWYRDWNPEMDFEAVFSDLCNELKHFIEASTECEGVRICVSDSSRTTDTGEKKSRHIIAKHPYGMFKNNAHVGAMARCFEMHILRKYGPPKQNKFYIYTMSEEERAGRADRDVMGFMFDNVYTRYRGIRLIGSTKIGKKSHLWPIGGWLDNKKDMRQFSFTDFLDTLIQYTPLKRVKILVCKEPGDVDARFSSRALLRYISFDENQQPSIDVQTDYASFNCSENAFYSTNTKRGKKDDNGVNRWHIGNEHDNLLQSYDTFCTDHNIPIEIKDLASRVVSKWFKSTAYADTLVSFCSGLVFVFSNHYRFKCMCPHRKAPHASNRAKFKLSLCDVYGSVDVRSAVSCMDDNCPSHFVNEIVWTKEMMGLTTWQKVCEYVKSKWLETEVEGESI